MITAASWIWSAGLFGEFVTHPGAFLAVERPVLGNDIHQVLVGARAGGYHHPQSHTGFFAQGEVGYRLSGHRGPFLEASTGLGAQQSFLAGPVWQRRNGEIRRTVDLGRPSLRGSLALGAGWALTGPHAGVRRVFGRVEGWLRTPVNRAVIPGFGVALGVAWGRS